MNTEHETTPARPVAERREAIVIRSLDKKETTGDVSVSGAN
ncbi:hypothetical protein [Nocardia cyriacigeorgica]|uniref:Uncharacterized protein n=1 Tax=Nocardia cyriacigeorgica TaxID=135487 RepID=A0A4U8W0C7_9NOCA|nr:hypothetical protein [Nocardia cyriacigeorgica]VFA97804.1 Uncharacterised protein [Nocardia cyriacigeorgica]